MRVDRLPPHLDSPVSLMIPHGWLALTPLPALGEVSDLALQGACPDLVHPQEWAHVGTLRGYRRITFVGGRIALATAAKAADVHLGPVFPDDRGAPVVPPPLCASVSHKLDPKADPFDDGANLAAALVAKSLAPGEKIGVDVEIMRPRRPDIERHILRPIEIERLDGLDEKTRARAILRAFSLKEALYKALDPHVRRYVGFREVEHEIQPDGHATFRFFLDENEGPFSAEGHIFEAGPLIVTTVRLAPLS